MIKKIISFFIALVFAVSSYIMWDFGVTMAEIENQTNLTMDVTYGYDNSAKVGRFIPVYLSCSSNKDAVFEGKAQFLSMESDQEIYRYEYPITILPGETIEKHVDIPLGVNTDQIYVSLVSDKNEVVLKKKLTLNISKDFAELFIGILSDSADQLEYLDSVGVSYSVLKTKTFHLDEDIFPQEEIGLNLLDVVLISDYQVAKLSAVQLNALEEWVEHGGLLILGTGQGVAGVLGPFADRLLETPYDQPRKTLVNFGVEYAVMDPGDAQVEIPCIDFNLIDGNVIFSDDQLSLVSVVNREKGAIAVAAFDFKDIATFALENPSYVDKLFTTLLGEEKINGLSENIYGEDSGQYWAIKNMLNIGDVSRLPALRSYVIVIIIYLLLLGPCLFILLKRTELSRYYRTGVVVLAFVFTGIIYFMGGRTRFQSTFFNYATFLDVSADAINETTYVNIRNPENTSYHVNINPFYAIKPITQVNYNELPDKTKVGKMEEPNIIIDYQDDVTMLSADRVAAFEPQYIQIDKTVANQNQSGFTGELIWFDGKLSGTIANHFEYPVENTTVLLYGKLVQLGTLEAGESKILDQIEPINYPFNEYSLVAELISGSSGFDRVDIENVQYIDAWKKANLVSFYLEYFLSTYSSDVRVMGIHTQDTSDYFLPDQKKETNGLTVVSSSVGVVTAKQDLVYRSGLAKKPKVISGRYDSYRNSISWGDAVVLEYALGSDITIEKLTFYQVADIFQNMESYLGIFIGDIYFYNYNSGSYELMNEQQQIYDGQQLEPFLSPSNTMMIKYVSNGALTNRWDVILPTLMLIGRDE